MDELGYVPLSKTGAELLFEAMSQRYERGSVLLTSNLLFEEWMDYGSGLRAPAGALLDRQTHRGHILAIQGDAIEHARPTGNEI